MEMEKRIDGSSMDRPIEKKNTWFKKLRWPVFMAILLLILIWQILFTDHIKKYQIEADRVTVESVIYDKYQDYISVTGTVEPIRTIFLDAIEGGRVEEIIAEEGSKVEKGDVILRLSNINLLLEISNNEAQVARAINELRQAKLLMTQTKLNNEQNIIELEKLYKSQERQWNNNQKLFDSKHISFEQFQQSKEQYQASLKTLGLLKENQKQDSLFRSIQVTALESSVQRMEQNLGIIRKRLDALEIKAPVDGELATLNPEIGEVVTYGSRIGIINVLDSYKMRIEVDEHYIARVVKGLRGEYEFAGATHQLMITKIYPEVKNNRFALDMEFLTDIPEQIRIGQTSRIRLELGQSKDAILIPRGSFYQSTGGQWIFVLHGSGDYAEKRAVRLGRNNPNYYEVIEGLKEGEKVIVSGYEAFGDAEQIVLKK